MSNNLTLITGSTGLIGFNIAEQLLAKNRKVRVLVRNVEKAKQVLPSACEFYQGDITDIGSIEKAMQDVAIIYHCAGLPEQWLKSNTTFDIINANGTKNIVDIALKNKVNKFIYTSTIDVFKAGKGEQFDESIIDDQPKGTYYERSKQKADKIVTDALQKGLQAIFLHPSGVYGYGPKNTGEAGLNGLLIKYYKKELPAILPGGMPVVYSTDVASGHILAEEKAKTGARYILSEEYYPLVDIFKIAAPILNKTYVPFVVPLSIAKGISRMGELVASVINKPPLVPAGQLTFSQWQAKPINTKAKKELGWTSLSLHDGIKTTIDFLKQSGQI